RMPIGYKKGERLPVRYGWHTGYGAKHWPDELWLSILVKGEQEWRTPGAKTAFCGRLLVGSYHCQTRDHLEVAHVFGIEGMAVYKRAGGNESIGDGQSMTKPILSQQGHRSRGDSLCHGQNRTTPEETFQAVQFPPIPTTNNEFHLCRATDVQRAMLLGVLNILSPGPKPRKVSMRISVSTTVRASTLT